MMALQAARTQSLVNMLVCRSVVHFGKKDRDCLLDGQGAGRINECAIDKVIYLDYLTVEKKNTKTVAPEG